MSDRLGISFCPDNPYKLCDLRPFYGYVHKDLLETYDFWGFGDLDLLWGDIKKFCADKILDRKDVFSTHADRVSGHFALIVIQRTTGNCVSGFHRGKTNLKTEGIMLWTRLIIAFCFMEKS